MNRKIRMKSLYMYIFIFWYSTEILFNSTLDNILGVSVDNISNLIAWMVFGLLMLQIILFSVIYETGIDDYRNDHAAYCDCYFFVRE